MLTAIQDIKRIEPITLKKRFFKRMARNHKDTLGPLWQKVNEMDVEVLKILARRDAVRRKLAAFKMQNDIPVEIEGRRDEILSAIFSTAEELELDRDFIKKVYEIIIEHSLNYEHRIRNEEIV